LIIVGGIVEVGKMNLLITIALLFIVSFSFPLLGSSDYANTPPVLFIKEYANFAWGISEGGWFIDSTGSVFTFDRAKDSVWTLAINDSLTPQQMQHMHNFATASNQRISNDTLIKMSLLIQPARTGGISNFDNGCRDFGGVEYRAYYFDSIAMIYRTVRLFAYGDMGLRNSSPAAITIAKWLVYTIDSLNPVGPCMSSIEPPNAILFSPKKSFSYKNSNQMTNYFDVYGRKVSKELFSNKVYIDSDRHIIFNMLKN
jgi:hypothetical protein